MKFPIFIFFFFILNIPFAQAESFDDFLSKAKKIKNSAEKKQYISKFIENQKTIGFPIIENGKAHFIYLGKAKNVKLAGGMNFWQPQKKHRLKKLKKSELWYLTMELEPQARFDYKFILNDKEWVVDNLNDKKTRDPFGGFNSSMWMSDYEIPWEIEEKENIPRGTHEVKTIPSRFTNNQYELMVYLPPNFSKEKKYPTIYFQDGRQYFFQANTPNIIENLLHEKKIAPFIGVFVQPNNRDLEYVYFLKKKYTNFFVQELVPFIDSIYPTKSSADQRVVIGDSFGGSIAAEITFQNSDVFGNTGWHSAAFWTNQYEVNNIVLSEKKYSIRVASIWGSYEGELATNMQRVMKELENSGYDIFQKELPQGHDWSLWQATLDDMFIFFFPAEEEK